MTNRALTRGTPNQRRAYLSFLVGTRRYAVDIQHVFEVSNLVEISGVPDMPAAILGVVNIRGSIVPVLDLRIRFNMPNRDLLLSTPIVFLRHGQGKVGTYAIIVDDVEDVLTLFTDEINTSDLNKRAPHIVGMVEYKENLIMILDPVQLLGSSLEGQNAEEFVDQLHG